MISHRVTFTLRNTLPWTMVALMGCPLSFEVEPGKFDATTIVGQGDAGPIAKDALPGDPDSGGMDAGQPIDVGPPPDGGADTRILSVNLSGSGEGVVRSTPAGIDCGSDCNKAFPIGTLVTLSVAPANGSTFSRWTGACSGGGLCQVRMDEDKTVNAVLEAADATVTVVKTGNGNGTVNSVPLGIACGNDCEETWPGGTMVTLVALPDAGQEFAGWGGDCQGMGDCRLTVDGPKNVTAQFDVRGIRLTIQKTGNGMGTVRSTPSGIDCGNTCSTTYDFGTDVELTAEPAPGTIFRGWSGVCTGTDRTCRVRMSSARTVQANFELQRFALEVTSTGNGSGTISSMPAGVDCGNDCREEYDFGTQVTLTAAADMGSTFTGFGGDCVGVSPTTCTITIDADKQVSGAFELEMRQLVITKQGPGTGTVFATDQSFSCGMTCNIFLPFNQSVTLRAEADTGASFDGWNGAGCNGTGECTFMMTANRNVIATFGATPMHDLVVSEVGSGGGRITSMPPGIDCPGQCTASFPEGTMVQLVPAPDGNSGFEGWSGDCTRAGECIVRMDGDKGVDGSFDLGLMAFFPFEGNANDASRRGHDGTVNGANLAADRDGNASSAYTFNFGDTISVDDAPDLSGFQRHTVCGWAFPTRTSSNDMFIAAKTRLFDGTGASDSYYISISSRQSGFEPSTRAWTDDGATTTQTNNGAPLNQWRHVCGRYDSNDLDLFVDGQLVTSTELDGVINDSSTPLVIGGCTSAGAQCSQLPFYGRIDDVKIWNRAITNGEVRREFDR